MMNLTMRIKNAVLPLVLSAFLLFLGSELARSQSTFTVPSRYEVKEFAREPMIMNPVAISVGNDGSVYVAETRRRKASNLDIRANTDWLNNELSFKTVAEKEAFYRLALSPENSGSNTRRVPDHNGDGSHDYRDLSVHSELLHRLVDTDGDGAADASTLFAEDFRKTLTGVAAGIHAAGDRVYATIAPDVWMLQDKDGDGVSDERKVVATGYGVHIAYAGHNLHGPIMGPDGRLYWTVGDNGSDMAPNEGGLYRCDPDGGNVELFARGLRNAQEVVFDKYGNIFTGDNDGDFGDRERWYHVVEGGDYGWRTHWQYQVGRNYGARPETYALWNQEKLWHLWFPGQAAYIIPATAHIGAGPCGMSYYPGTGFGPEMDDHFFLAHFTGSAGSSKINTFTLEPDGASYRVTKDEPFVSNITATGVDFSPDGSRLYFSEWTGGWSLGSEGRVYYLQDPKLSDSTGTVSTKALLNSGMSGRPAGELATIMAHPNMYVRRMAQFELAERGGESVETLTSVALSPGDQLARIHALWGLEQIHRRDGKSLSGVVRLLFDADDEIRAQAAKMMGEGKVAESVEGLVALLNDANPRVQFWAAMSLGKLKASSAMDGVLSMIAANGTSDRFTRHAGIMALTWNGDVDQLASLENHPSQSVRMAAVVALRKLERPEVVRFLHDDDELVVIEAARTINDVPLERGRSSLAGLIENLDSQNDWLVRRVLNANFKLGDEENVTRLVNYAADADGPDEMRLEALRMLADWEGPSPRDRVTGAWLPISATGRAVGLVAVALQEHLVSVIFGNSDYQSKATRILGTLGVRMNREELVNWAVDSGRESSVRISALELLADESEAFSAAQRRELLVHPDSGVYAAALRFEKLVDSDSALSSIRSVLEGDDTRRSQAALAALVGFESTDAIRTIAEVFERFAQGDLPNTIHLDVLNAAEQSSDASVVNALESWKSSLSADDEIARYRVALHGGSAENGRSIFHEKAELQCLRCHKVDPAQVDDINDAAPNLAGIGNRATRDYILESILLPNRAFAAGHEQVILKLRDGRVVSGRVAARNGDLMTIQSGGSAEDNYEEETSEPAITVVREGDVVEMEKGLSAMPGGMADMMTLSELRDLVEFLATQ